MKSTRSETAKKAEAFPKAVLKKIAKNIGNFLKFIGPTYSKDYKAKIDGIRSNPKEKSAAEVKNEVRKERISNLTNGLDSIFGSTSMHP